MNIDRNLISDRQLLFLPHCLFLPPIHLSVLNISTPPLVNVSSGFFFQLSTRYYCTGVICDSGQTLARVLLRKTEANR